MFFFHSLLTCDKVTASALSNTSTHPHTTISATEKGLSPFLSLFKARTLPLPSHWSELGHTPPPDPTTEKVNRMVVIGSGKLQLTPQSGQGAQDRHLNKTGALLAPPKRGRGIINIYFSSLIDTQVCPNI